MEILFKAGEDDELGLVHLGILVRFCIHGPITLEVAIDWYTAGDLDILVRRGYLEPRDDGYKVAGIVDDNPEAKALWKAFYKAYPGTKLGEVKQYEVFRTKYKKAGKWRVILPTLMTELQRQLLEREQIARAIEKAKLHGEKTSLFIPAWKNLSTYINQQGWTEVMPVPAEVAAPGPAAAPEPVSPDDPYDKYLAWALEKARGYGMSEFGAKGILLTRTEFNGMINGSEPPYVGFVTYTTIETLKKHIAAWTIAYISDSNLRRAHDLLSDYCKKAFKHKFKNIE